MRRLLRALVLVLVLACSPEPTSAPPAPVRTPQSEASPPAEDATDQAAGSQARVRRPLRYVALGDSLASGMAGIDGGRSYAEAYARLLRRRTQRKVVLTNLGVPGLDSTQLLDALRDSEEVRSAVSKADVVTWDIGGNDLIEVAVQVSSGACGGEDGLACLPASRNGFAQRWHAIVDELVDLRRSPRVRLQTFTLYRPFATIRGVHVDALLRDLDARNAIIDSSDGQRGVQVADVAEAYADGPVAELIDADGLHPTAAGHGLIARELLALDP